MNPTSNGSPEVGLRVEGRDTYQDACIVLDWNIPGPPNWGQCCLPTRRSIIDGAGREDHHGPCGDSSQPTTVLPYAIFRARQFRVRVNRDESTSSDRELCTSDQAVDGMIRNCGVMGKELAVHQLRGVEYW